jgi:hypothetical protein
MKEMIAVFLATTLGWLALTYFVIPRVLEFLYFY